MHQRQSYAMNLSSQRDGDMSQRVSFTDVPEEIRRLIIDELSIHDKALLARTSKFINAYIAPSLYEKMYTRLGTRQDTDGLVQLLRKRPDIVPLIQVLVIDEYHPRHTRRLLSIEMPNLNCLLVQHASDSIEHVSEREKRALNRNLVEQPKLTQCKPPTAGHRLVSYHLFNLLTDLIGSQSFCGHHLRAYCRSKMLVCSDSPICFAYASQTLISPTLRVRTTSL